MARTLAFRIPLLLVASLCFGQITFVYPSGSWTTLDANDLNPNVPGANFNIIQLPDIPNTYLFSVTPSKNNWQLDVNLVSPLPAGITSVEICRTGDGVGVGGGTEIVGGLTWLALTTSPQTLFTGKKIRNNVPMSLRITVNLLSLAPASPLAVGSIYFDVH